MENYAPISTPMNQKLAEFRQRTLPLLVWLLAAASVALMLGRRAQQSDQIGLAESLQYEISAEARGRIETVLVDVYENVRAGDVVARLNDDLVVANIRTAAANIRRLSAELEAERIRLSAEQSTEMADWTADLRRFQSDEERRRLSALEIRVSIEADQVELERLALELRRNEPLLEAGLIGQRDLDNVRLRHERLGKQIDENRVLLAQTEQEFRTAQERRSTFERDLPELPRGELLLQPLQESIAVESRRLDEIEVGREALILRSPVDGQVSQVLCRQGQAVVAGEPILTIAERSVQQIVAFLHENDQRPISPSTPVLLSSASRGGDTAESIVLRVGPAIEPLPQQLWADPRVPRYGRAVVIAAAPGLNLIPGEAVRVRFLGGD